MTSLLAVDQETLVRSFGRAPFAVRHSLVDHPLLQLGAIAELAESLSAGQVEHNLGQVPELLPDGEAPRADLSAGEIVRTIETNGCWMVLKRIESDERYRSLLERSLDEIIPHVAQTEGGATRKEGFIFLSAPNSTTPVHIDPEHNLLLQIRGTKKMTVGSFPSAKAEVSELERYYGGGHRNLDGFPAATQEFALGPGDGVYVPVHAPHWVKNGAAVSISLSITFYTRRTELLSDLHAVNARLRRLRLSPGLPGQRPARDRAKVRAWRGIRRGGAAVRRLRSSRRAG